VNCRAQESLASAAKSLAAHLFLESRPGQKDSYEPDMVYRSSVISRYSVDRCNRIQVVCQIKLRRMIEIYHNLSLRNTGTKEKQEEWKKSNQPVKPSMGPLNHHPEN